MEPTPLPRNFQSSILKNRNIHVLLADDNRVNQFLGKRILQNLGITKVDLVSNGNEAFDAARKHHYDLLLTDVEMPGMNGYELANTIRSLETGNEHLLIIALTANATDEDREKAVTSGIDDYLTKPYTPQDLQKVLLRHLKPDELQIQERDVDAPANEINSQLSAVYELFHHNGRDVRHFLVMLSQQLPALTDDIRQALNNEQWDDAFQYAHKLKSPVNILGSTTLRTSLEVFTEDLRYQRNLSNVSSQFEAILPALESLQVLVITELGSPD